MEAQLVEVAKPTVEKSTFQYKQEGQIINSFVETKTTPYLRELAHLPMVLPFSIDSIFHQNILGSIKVQALLNYVKSRAKNKVLILFCEGAHLNVLSIKYKNNDSALTVSKNTAKELYNRFKNYLEGFEISFWDEFILRNKNYRTLKTQLLDVYASDTNFYNWVKIDADKIASTKMSKEYGDKDLLTIKSKLDLFEIILSVKIMCEEGYRAVVYPGPVYASMKYLNPLYYDPIFVNASVNVSQKSY